MPDRPKFSLLRHTIAVALSFAATTLLVGCGSNDPAPDPGPGRLRVDVQLPGVPIGVEGSVTFLRLTTRGGADDGTLVVEAPLTRRAQRTDAPLSWTRSLPAGDYRLVSYQRTCGVNCAAPDGYDPPIGRCEGPLAIEGGEVTIRQVVVRRSGQCSIEG